MVTLAETLDPMFEESAGDSEEMPDVELGVSDEFLTGAETGGEEAAGSGTDVFSDDDFVYDDEEIVFFDEDEFISDDSLFEEEVIDEDASDLGESIEEIVVDGEETGEEQSMLFSDDNPDNGETEESGQELSFETTLSITIPLDGMAENDELFADYANRKFAGNMPEETGLRKTKSRGGNSFSGPAAVVYNMLKSAAQEIADGERDYSIVQITKEDAGVQDVKWSRFDLGVDAIFEGEGMSNELVEGVRPLIENQFLELTEFYSVLNDLLYSEPYLFYWYDKSVELNMSFQIGGEEREYKNPDTQYCWINHVYIRFPVTSEYAGTEAYSVDTTKTGSTIQAVNNAALIVEQNTELNDLGKLNAYRTAICDLVSFDETAASVQGAYGNPWQMINVFDGDPSTNAVSEGYAKAFQYLCNSTVFSSELTCYTVTGTKMVGNESEPHMWNIVTMEDERNYLVDITSCDTGAIGADNLLFLATPSSGSVSDGYSFVCNDETVTYTYDSDTLSVYTTDELTLSGDSYDENAYYLYDADTQTLTITRNTPNFVSDSSWSLNYDTPWVSYKDQIKNIRLAYTVDTIGEGSFCGLSQLENVSWYGNPDYSYTPSILSYGKNSFRNCTSLQGQGVFGNEFDVFAGTDEIGDYAFSGCTSLNVNRIVLSADTVGTEFASGVHTEELVFNYTPYSSGVNEPQVSGASLSGLKVGTVYANNTPSGYGQGLWGWYADGDALYVGQEMLVEDTWTYVPQTLWLVAEDVTSLTVKSPSAYLNVLQMNETITHLSVPYMTQIDSNTFVGMRNLQTLQIPKGASIKGSPFQACLSLASITNVPEENQSGGEPNDEEQLVTGTISVGAFIGCHSLGKLLWSDESTFTTLPYNCFASCESLTEVRLPSSLETVADYAFGRTENAIPSIVLEFSGDAPALSAHSFTGLGDVTIECPVDNQTWMPYALSEETYGAASITWPAWTRSSYQIETVTGSIGETQSLFCSMGSSFDLTAHITYEDGSYYDITDWEIGPLPEPLSISGYTADDDRGNKIFAMLVFEGYENHPTHPSPLPFFGKVYAGFNINVMYHFEFSVAGAHGTSNDNITTVPTNPFSFIYEAEAYAADAIEDGTWDGTVELEPNTLSKIYVDADYIYLDNYQFMLQGEGSLDIKVYAVSTVDFLSDERLVNGFIRQGGDYVNGQRIDLHQEDTSCWYEVMIRSGDDGFRGKFMQRTSASYTGYSCPEGNYATYDALSGTYHFEIFLTSKYEQNTTFLTELSTWEPCSVFENDDSYPFEEHFALKSTDEYGNEFYLQLFETEEMDSEPISLHMQTDEVCDCYGSLWGDKLHPDSDYGPIYFTMNGNGPEQPMTVTVNDDVAYPCGLNDTLNLKVVCGTEGDARIVTQWEKTAVDIYDTVVEVLVSADQQEDKLYAFFFKYKYDMGYYDLCTTIPHSIASEFMTPGKDYFRVGVISEEDLDWYSLDPEYVIFSNTYRYRMSVSVLEPDPDVSETFEEGQITPIITLAAGEKKAISLGEIFAYGPGLMLKGAGTAKVTYFQFGSGIFTTYELGYSDAPSIVNNETGMVYPLRKLSDTYNKDETWIIPTGENQTVMYALIEAGDSGFTGAVYQYTERIVEEILMPARFENPEIIYNSDTGTFTYPICLIYGNEDYHSGTLEQPLSYESYYYYYGFEEDHRVTFDQMVSDFENAGFLIQRLDTWQVGDFAYEDLHGNEPEPVCSPEESYDDLQGGNETDLTTIKTLFAEDGYGNKLAIVCYDELEMENSGETLPISLSGLPEYDTDCALTATLLNNTLQFYNSSAILKGTNGPDPYKPLRFMELSSFTNLVEAAQAMKNISGTPTEEDIDLFYRRLLGGVYGNYADYSRDFNIERENIGSELYVIMENGWKESQTIQTIGLLDSVLVNNPNLVLVQDPRQSTEGKTLRIGPTVQLEPSTESDMIGVHVDNASSLIMEYFWNLTLNGVEWDDERTYHIKVEVMDGTTHYCKTYQTSDNEGWTDTGEAIIHFNMNIYDDLGNKVDTGSFPSVGGPFMITGTLPKLFAYYDPEQYSITNWRTLDDCIVETTSVGMEITYPEYIIGGDLFGMRASVDVDYSGLPDRTLKDYADLLAKVDSMKTITEPEALEQAYCELHDMYHAVFDMKVFNLEALQGEILSDDVLPETWALIERADEILSGTPPIVNSNTAVTISYNEISYDLETFPDYDETLGFSCELKNAKLYALEKAWERAATGRTWNGSPTEFNVYEGAQYTVLKIDQDTGYLMLDLFVYGRTGDILVNDDLQCPYEIVMTVPDSMRNKEFTIVDTEQSSYIPRMIDEPATATSPRKLHFWCTTCDVNNTGDMQVVCLAMADRQAAKVGETFYASLQDAIDAVYEAVQNGVQYEEPVVIRLFEDVEEDIVIPQGLEITLDLNGHTLKNWSDGNTVTNNGNLGVVDEGEDDFDDGPSRVMAKGGLRSKAASGSKILNDSAEGTAIYNAGTLSLASVTVEATGTDTSAIVNEAAAEADIQEGAVIINNSEETPAIANSGELTVSGGTVTGDISNAVATSSTTVTSGSVNGTIVNEMEGAQITVSGGSVGDIESENTDDVTIEGGTFENNVDQYLNGDDYTTVQQDDGSYTVLDVVRVTVRSILKGTEENPVEVASVSGGGKYGKGETATVVAPRMAGLTFLGWFEEADGSYIGDVISNAARYSFMVAADTSLIAVYEMSSSSTVTLNVMGTNFRVNGGPVQKTGYYMNKFPRNESITLEATGDSDDFLYWMNGSNKILTRETMYTFVITGDTTLTAVYKYTDEATAFVEFVSEYDQIMQAQVYAADSEILFPGGPSLTGYRFTGWDHTEDQIHEKIRAGQTYIVVRGNYQKLNVSYTLTVKCDGITVNTTEYEAYKRYSVRALDIGGRTFSHWIDEKGTKLSTKPVFSFYLSKDTILTGVYVNEGQEVVREPVIAMMDVFGKEMNSNGKYPIVFVVNRSVPEGYTINRHGVIIIPGSTYSGDNIDEDLTLEADSPKPTVKESSDLSLDGNYTYTGNMGSQDSVLHVRGYMVVTTADGNRTETLYTNVVSASNRQVFREIIENGGE